MKACGHMHTLSVCTFLKKKFKNSLADFTFNCLKTEATFNETRILLTFYLE